MLIMAWLLSFTIAAVSRCSLLLLTGGSTAVAMQQLQHALRHHVQDRAEALLPSLQRHPPAGSELPSTPAVAQPSPTAREVPPSGTSGAALRSTLRSAEERQQPPQQPQAMEGVDDEDMQVWCMPGATLGQPQPAYSTPAGPLPAPSSLSEAQRGAGATSDGAGPPSAQGAPASHGPRPRTPGGGDAAGVAGGGSGSAGAPGGAAEGRAAREQERRRQRHSAEQASCAANFLAALLGAHEALKP